MKRALIFLFFTLLAPTAFAEWCWQEASHSSGVPVEILVSVASAESSFNPKAVNYNKDKARSLFVKIVVTVFTLPISVLYSLVVPG